MARANGARSSRMCACSAFGRAAPITNTARRRRKARARRGMRSWRFLDSDAHPIDQSWLARTADRLDAECRLAGPKVVGMHRGNPFDWFVHPHFMVFFKADLGGDVVLRKMRGETTDTGEEATIRLLERGKKIEALPLEACATLGPGASACGLSALRVWASAFPDDRRRGFPCLVWDAAEKGRRGGGGRNGGSDHAPRLPDADDESVARVLRVGVLAAHGAWRLSELVQDRFRGRGAGAAFAERADDFVELGDECVARALVLRGNAAPPRQSRADRPDAE